MRRSPAPTLFFGFCLVLACLAPAAFAAGPASPSDFSGRWTLDAERSENPRDKMPHERPSGGGERPGYGGPGGGESGGSRSGGGPGPGGGQRGPGGPGGGQRGPGGGPGGGGPSGGGPPGDREAMHARREAMEKSLAALAIATEGATLTVASTVAGSDYRQVLYTDGRTFEFQDDHGMTVDASAIWQTGGQLVVRFVNPRGDEVVETWELVDRRLQVTTRIAGDDRRPPLEFKRVYDRQAS